MTKLVTISVGVRGEKEVSRQLGLSAEVIGDLRHVFEESALPFMLDHMKKQFATEGAHGGSKWAGYDKEPKYRAYKRASVGHLDILRWDKGGKYERLYPSLTGKGNKFSVRESGRSRFRFGTRVPYATRLTRGGTGPFDEPYPGRRIIRMRNSQKSELVRSIQRGIVSRFGAERLRRARVV